MKNCGNILFDLDGTLIDSYPGVSAMLKITFAELGVEYNGDYSEFIGPPFNTALPEFLGLDEELTQKVCARHRELYAEKGVYDYKVFNGVMETLKALHGAKKKLYVVTSKLEAHAAIEIKRSGMDAYICHIYGQNEDGTRGHKTDVMRYALSEGALDPKDCVMVGDRLYDINAANEFGMKSIGVMHGYGSKEELLACGPTALAKDMYEVKELLL